MEMKLLLVGGVFVRIDYLFTHFIYLFLLEKIKIKIRLKYLIFILIYLKTKKFKT